MKRILLQIILVFSFMVFLPAQELIPLFYNHAIKKQGVKDLEFKSTSPDFKYLTPPPPDGSHYFFDDFANYNFSVYPDTNLWSDKAAFVNQTYPDSCVSIGVATLDGVDSNGDLYSFIDGSFPSDTLTARSIDLNGEAGNIYLSFFYQGGGKGDAPDINDSLIVDFYHADSNKWYMAWHSLGFQSNTFEQVVLEIADSLRTDEFKFRFRNWTSTDIRDSKGGDESGIANSDQWHIDYIQVRNVSSIDQMYAINDASFVYPLNSTHKFYHSLPYKHLNYSQGDRRPTSDITVRTIFPNEASVTVNRMHQTYNIYGGSRTPVGSTELEENEQEDEFLRYTDFFTPAYSYNPEQAYGYYEYISFLDIIPSQYKWNDTVKKREIFQDYYAYDDGTAEFGFGLPGNGGVNMRLAYQFPLAIRGSNPADTLTAIDIHFVKTRNNASNNVEFIVCVWDHHGDKPGELLYPPLQEGNLPTDKIEYPDTTLGINEFMRIELDEELIVKDTIYIGLVQLNLGSIGIGYDINSGNRSAIYTNDGNQWLQTIATIPQGSLMLRPVFGNFEYASTIKQNIVNKKHEVFKLFPLPVSNSVNIELLLDDKTIEEYRFSVFNLVGKTLVSGEILQETIDLSSLPQGMYFLRIRDKVTSETFIHKIIKKE